MRKSTYYIPAPGYLGEGKSNAIFHAIIANWAMGKIELNVHIAYHRL